MKKEQKQLIAELSEDEYKEILEAAKMANHIPSTLSAGDAKVKLNKAITLLKRFDEHESAIAQRVATAILKEAKRAFKEGSVGNGFYLID